MFIRKEFTLAINFFKQQPGLSTSYGAVGIDFSEDEMGAEAALIVAQN